MPSSGGPTPFGWTTSSPSSPEYSLARAWHLSQEGGAWYVRGLAVALRSPAHADQHCDVVLTPPRALKVPRTWVGS